ncbi:amidohydrolase family protein [Hoeflea sp. AS16]|uniref:amidohydrolase family protein n=1 Tax=Hoeflea sp. AS16 TaxID=3135779 RepID=UPI003180F84D
MDIIDSHHHIWRQVDLKWLQGPMQPRIFGDYESIRRDYPIEEYLDDVASSGVTKSVYVQANWPNDQFEDEVRWVQETADRSGWPHGIVGYADMTLSDARPQLERLAAYPAMRGIRQQFHWHENPLYRFAASASMAEEPVVQDNIRKLSEFGWTFDLQLFAGQMKAAVGLARACPDVTFILQHAGMPEDLSVEGWAAWQTGMRAMAEMPNVVSKLSGFGTFVHRVDAELIKRIIFETVEMFGPERCMFGSNFPIEKIWSSYEALVQAHMSAVSELGDTAMQQIFHDTAARVYRL